MPSAKDIRLAPIGQRDAAAFIKRHHYSGTYARNSQLHFGVFLGGFLEGVMQFGPSLDRRKIKGLVADTPWNGFLELNRMAFTEALPRNSESRALGVALRIIRQRYSHIQWVISFADAAQCGDGTIYRAAGFALTGIKPNQSLWHNPKTGERFFDMTARMAVSRSTFDRRGQKFAGTGAASMRPFIEAGFEPIPGFQLRYIYFIDPTARARLAVPILPFSKIQEMGAAMYRGEKCAGKHQAPECPSGLGGENPTPALQI